jgi:protein arginine kinase
MRAKPDSFIKSASSWSGHRVEDRVEDDEILKMIITHESPWLSASNGRNVVISSRVRLARNINGFPFPDWATKQQRTMIVDRISQILPSVETLKNSKFISMASVSEIDVEVLKERHIISRELGIRKDGSGVIISQDEHIAIMINEEDHMRLQVITAGLDLRGIWQKIDTLDSEFDQHLEYAFSNKYGFITACPTNLGTGLRASVMMHLIGLRMMNEINKVINALTQLRVAVRGLFGEGSEAFGDMFQLSNMASLGVSELDIVNHITGIAKEVAEHEENARARLVEGQYNRIVDRVGRAYGTLMYAQLLSSTELVDLLSILRLGVEIGLVKNLSIDKINNLLLLTQPGHLQKITGRVLTPEERDELRADFVRKSLKDTEIESLSNKKKESEIK